MSKLWWVKRDQLDEVQLEVVDYAGKGRGFVLTGPPGSGKTNLLMLAAATMKGRGYDNSKVVVFTSTLRDFISKGVSTYKLPADTVTTLNQVAYTIVRDHGDSLPNGVSFRDRQAAWRNHFAKYVDGGTSNLRVFDSLLIDESQDFNAAEATVLYESTKYVAFAIDTNQSIYERKDGKHPVLQTVEKYAIPQFNLKCHYRVGRRICRFADLLMEGRPGYESIEENSMYSEEERPSLVSYENMHGDSSAEFDRIVGRVTGQLAVYPGERIGILFPTNDQINQFRAHCTLEHSGFLNNELEDPTGLRADLMIGTMHEAKGLEFAVVHLAGQEKLSAFATQRNLLFTGVTRARYACYITAIGLVPGYLTSAYNRLDGPVDTTAKNIFPE